MESDLEQPQVSKPKPYRRMIWATILLTLYNPGLSLIYDGNLKGGIILFIIFALLSSVFEMMLGVSFYLLVLTILIAFSLAFWMLIYTIRYTLRANQLGYRRIKMARRLILLLIICELIFSIVSGTFIKAYIVEAYKIPSGSMENTLIPGDYLMASKGIDTDNLQRGNLIIFKFPGDLSKDYIKRIVGLGGDRIKIIDKQLYVNDQQVPLPPTAAFSDSANVYPHTDTKQWKINDKALGDKGGYWLFNGNRDNMPEMTVPQGDFFVLGDNRDNSLDSRFYGPVDAKLVLGRAKFIHFSWDSEKHRIRWERMGEKLE